jgi:hypothetical protein
MIVGDKRRTKSEGKTAKATKKGLRPHEQRAQQDVVKPAPGGGAKPPRT